MKRAIVSGAKIPANSSCKRFCRPLDVPSRDGIENVETRKPLSDMIASSAIDGDQYRAG